MSKLVICWERDRMHCIRLGEMNYSDCLEEIFNIHIPMNLIIICVWMNGFFN